MFHVRKPVSHLGVKNGSKVFLSAELDELTDGPQLMMVRLKISLQRCKSNSHSVERVLQILHFDRSQNTTKTLQERKITV